MTASSSASWSRFSPPSNFVNGHVSTMWFMVCRWPQSQEGDWARPHLCKFARHGPWPVRKRFSRDHVRRGRSKPDESAMTHAVTVVVTRDLDLWCYKFWPQNKWFFMTRRGTSVCQVWWSQLHRVLSCHADNQTDKRWWKPCPPPPSACPRGYFLIPILPITYFWTQLVFEPASFSTRTIRSVTKPSFDEFY